MHNRFVAPGRTLGFLPRRALGLAAVAALLPLAACNLDDALQVQDPFTVTPGTARDTVNLPTTFAGARARFATALAGSQNSEGGLIHQTGTFADELVDSDGFSTRQTVDQRIPTENNGASSFPYVYLQRARAEAVNAAALFATTSQAGSEMHVNLYNVIGFSELLLAESFCSGIPLSLVDVNGAFQPTAGLPTAQVLDSAIAAFDKAMSLAGSNYTAEVNLARVGKARALMFKGDYTGAAAVAATVPDNFKYFIEYDAATQTSTNAVEQLINEEKRWSTVDKEGGNGLDYMSAHDPRTPWGTATGTLYGSDGPKAALDGGEHFSQLKYPSRGSDVLLASGMEARYIQAEAALKGGNAATALTFLNAARAANGLGLTALTAAQFGATADAQARTLFRERAFSFWLTAHRVGDLRRMQKYFGFPANTIWPVGTDRRGAQYGTDVVLTIPQAERNNALFTGCLTAANVP